MKQYRKKPIVIEAVQWQPGLEIEDVEQVDPAIVRSRDGKYFYLSALGNPSFRADTWLSLESGKPALPFALYEMKSGETHPAHNACPLTQRYLQYLEKAELPPPFARIKTPEGVMIANAGDWIIRGVKGELYPCKPDIFDATYESVELEP